MKALLLNPSHCTATIAQIPKPTPSPNDLLIRVHAVALNPIDSLYVTHPLAPSTQQHRVIGSDFAGVIEAVGDDVPSVSSELERGDRVAGFLQGACSVNERPGAFAEWIVCAWDLVWKVEDGCRGVEEAAAVSLCGLTAAQALFFRMGLRTPFDCWHDDEVGTPVRATTTESAEPTTKPKSIISVFIYGASTSVGLYAAQLVRRSAESSGSTVNLLGTAGSKHFEMLRAKPYSYDELVDYHDEDWPTRIRGLTVAAAGVNYAYDCISEGATVSKTSTVLAPNGKMAIVRSREGGAWTAENLPIEPSYGAVWEGLGEVVEYQGMSLPASPKARRFAVAFYRWLSEGGKLQSNPLRKMPGGFEGIVDDGFRLLGSGSMGDRNVKSADAWMKPLSAEKMVYKIADG